MYFYQDDDLNQQKMKSERKKKRRHHRKHTPVPTTPKNENFTTISSPLPVLVEKKTDKLRMAKSPNAARSGTPVIVEDLRTYDAKDISLEIKPRKRKKRRRRAIEHDEVIPSFMTTFYDNDGSNALPINEPAYKPINTRNSIDSIHAYKTMNGLRSPLDEDRGIDCGGRTASCLRGYFYDDHSAAQSPFYCERRSRRNPKLADGTLRRSPASFPDKDSRRTPVFAERTSHRSPAMAPDRDLYRSLSMVPDKDLYWSPAMVHDRDLYRSPATNMVPDKEQGLFHDRNSHKSPVFTENGSFGVKSPLEASSTRAMDLPPLSDELQLRYRRRPVKLPPIVRDKNK